VEKNCKLDRTGPKKTGPLVASSSKLWDELVVVAQKGKLHEPQKNLSKLVFFA